MEAKVRTGAVLALFLCAPAAMAANDWAVISTGGDPDFITSFDINNPGGSNLNIGTVDGNFNRGMDFDSYSSFYYYVSTDSLNDPGDRGLWRWDNGANTQLFNTPFSDSGDGDATLSNDHTKFYITTNDGDATTGDSLYVFDSLTGAVSFTEIGETGLTDLIGIAVDPTTGILYGYDGGTEALYTISLTDGTPTLVGFSGELIAAIGGMDFSDDGQTLLLADDNDILFKVDKATGLMTPSGDVNLNVSALSYRTTLVPAPGALALLGLAGLAARRRRR
jgi:MYXO-CTERM domain-containing protein